MPEKDYHDYCHRALRAWLEASMHSVMRSFFLFSREKCLSFSQLASLHHIHKRGPCSVTDLGDALEITRAAASQMLDKMVGRHLVHRSHDPEDRRHHRHDITTEGMDLLQESIRDGQIRLSRLVDTLNEEECRKTAETLDLLTERLRTLNNNTDAAGLPH